MHKGNFLPSDRKYPRALQKRKPKRILIYDNKRNKRARHNNECGQANKRKQKIPKIGTFG